jgi:hypothetical protein
MREFFHFSDPEILRILNAEEKEGRPETFCSKRIVFSDDYWIDFSLSRKVQDTTPLIKTTRQWRLRFFSPSEFGSDGITIAATNWGYDKNSFSPGFVRIYEGLYKKCSESEMKEFLMKRSNKVAEWLLWNML